MPVTASGRHTGQLHRWTARHSQECEAHGGARCSNRRFVAPLLIHTALPSHAAFFSPTIGPSGSRERRIHAVRVSVDELSSHAGDQRAEHHSNVGYLSGAFPSNSLWRLFERTERQAEGTDAFSQFHLYVCSAFLVRWSKKLQEMDFQVGVCYPCSPRRLYSLLYSQGIIMFLQSLPTQDWGDHEIEMLLSEAFVHYSTWHNAQSHFGK